MSIWESKQAHTLQVVSSGSFLNKFHPSTAELGLVASLLTAGAFVGAALAGAVSDLAGRRGTIGIGGVTFCLGGALQTGAANYSYVIGGRFIAGVGQVARETSLIDKLIR